MTREISLMIGGDVMLGRGVNARILRHGPAWPWGDLLPGLREADGLFVNLECALTERTERWHDGALKAFYFRADPGAAESLRLAGVDFASVANNHIGDFGLQGMLDTLAALDRVGVHHAGAGRDGRESRAPAVLPVGDLRIAVVAAADYPEEWGAAAGRPGMFRVEVSTEPWAFDPVQQALAEARRLADFVVFSIHWGPNMREQPTPEFRAYARRVLEAGADLFWGHSAHVVQGVEVLDGRPILYDTGDLVDDYAVDEDLRNDLTALFRLHVAGGRVRAIELLPVRIADGCAHWATGVDRAWFEHQLRVRCQPLGTAVEETGSRDTLMIRGPRRHCTVPSP
jgi:poly-gamma-glutamate synthesis protein (capsule biosynthesis protein)